MGPVEALELALQQENGAISLYERLAKEHTSLQEVFTFLINEEHKHKQLIEKKIYEATRY